MRLLDLFEAPLASFDLYGDWSDTETHIEPRTSMEPKDRPRKNSFISKHDRNLIQNPRIQERVSNLLLKFPHPIYLTMWNSNKALSFFLEDSLDHGLLHPDQIRRLPNKLRTQVKKLPSDAIGVILTHNDGGDVRHPMTPWMIVHRMVHALFKGNPFKRWNDLAASSLRGAYKITTKVDGKTKAETLTGAGIREWLRLISTFKAARENNIFEPGGNNNFGEGFCEMFTQYMIKGTVPLQMPPEQFEFFEKGMGISTGYTIKYTLKNEAKVKEAMEKLKVAMESYFENCLQNAIGETYVC